MTNPFAPTAFSPIPVELSYQVTQATPQHISQISGWPSNAKSLTNAVKRKFGEAPDTGLIAEKAETIICGLGPATWMIFASEPPGLATIKPNQAAITDVSGGRVLFEISGEDSAIKLAQGAILDFSMDAFPQGSVKQSAIHHIPVTIIRKAEDLFLVSTLRSFGDDLEEWLKK